MRADERIDFIAVGFNNRNTYLHQRGGARLGRRDPGPLGAPVRRALGRPGRQRTQPLLRAHPSGCGPAGRSPRRRSATVTKYPAPLPGLRAVAARPSTRRAPARFVRRRRERRARPGDGRVVGQALHGATRSP
ncbi:hypothetical protein HBB16_04540 [Pseudonocardia sp. MCCB 268]|nr:hypothetical protein [Pseudonocardia cytotoxica]